jgi:hypothetical protein
MAFFTTDEDAAENLKALVRELERELRTTHPRAANDPPRRVQDARRARTPPRPSARRSQPFQTRLIGIEALIGIK